MRTVYKYNVCQVIVIVYDDLTYAPYDTWTIHESIHSGDIGITQH